MRFKVAFSAFAIVLTSTVTTFLVGQSQRTEVKAQQVNRQPEVTSGSKKTPQPSGEDGDLPPPPPDEKKEEIREISKQKLNEHMRLSEAMFSALEQKYSDSDKIEIETLFIWSRRILDCQLDPSVSGHDKHVPYLRHFNRMRSINRKLQLEVMQGKNKHDPLDIQKSSFYDQDAMIQYVRAARERQGK